MVLELLILYYQLAKQPEINHDFTSLNNNKQIEIIKQDSIERKIFDYSIKNNLTKDLNYSTFKDSLYMLSDSTITYLKEFYRSSENGQRRYMKEHFPEFINFLKNRDSLEVKTINPNLSYKEYQKNIQEVVEENKKDLDEQTKLRKFFENVYKNNEKVYLINNTLFRIKNNEINYLKIDLFESNCIKEYNSNFSK